MHKLGYRLILTEAVSHQNRTEAIILSKRAVRNSVLLEILVNMLSNKSSKAT